MAFAAIAKHFLVVDKRDDVKTQRGMTGFAHTAGSEVIRRLAGYLAGSRCSIELVAVTIQTNRRQPLVISGTGWAFGANRGHDELNRALAVNAFGADYELRHVGSPDVGDKTGICRVGILQYRIAGIGYG